MFWVLMYVIKAEWTVDGLKEMTYFPCFSL